MLHIADRRGRGRPLAPAAALLLALCLLAVGVQAVPDAVEPTAAALSPYPGTHTVPGLVWARDYDAGGEGVAYHDTEPANLGGAYRPAEGVDLETVGTVTNVGWVRSGEWLTYTVNASGPGPLEIVVEAANPDATTKRVAVLVDGNPAGTVDLRPTGGFGTYADCVSTPVTLPAGESAVRLSFDGVSRVNLLALDFREPFVEPTPVPTPPPALLVDTPGFHALDRDLNADWIGVEITSSDVVLDGMGHAIEGTGANATGVYALGLRTATSPGTITNVTVRNLTVRDCGAGIAIDGVVGSVVEHVVAERNTVGLVVHAYSGTGSDHLVRDSVFRENIRSGIELGFQGRGAAIERCSITGNGRGLTLDYFQSSDLTRNRIVDSTVSENAGTAISITDISGLLVANCTVSDNGGDGVYVEHSGGEIVGNRIENNAGTGVASSDRGGSNITSNWITGNGQGVVVGGDWGSDVRNNYLNNTDNGYFGVAVQGRLNFPRTPGTNIVGGPYLGGNFWAHPNGTGFSQTHGDRDNDGICDEAFVMEDATDYLPLAPAPAVPPNGSRPYRPVTLPGTIQAEDYDLGGEGIAYHDTTPTNEGRAYRNDGVDIEKMAGLATPNVGWTRGGEWLIYTVNVTTAGDYEITGSAASPNAFSIVDLWVDGVPAGDLIFEGTGSFATFRTSNPRGLALGAGTHTLKLVFRGDGLNLDWLSIAPQTPVPTQYRSHVLPCTIQAEDYDLGGEGVAYHDTTPTNEGGAYRQDGVDIEKLGAITNVGWIRSGEWLGYSSVLVKDDGTFTMTARIASPNSGRTMTLSDRGTPLATVVVPRTGSFGTFTNVSVPVTLESGWHHLRLTFAGDGLNLDWIAFATGPVVTPTPTPTPEPSGGASFAAVPTTAPYGSAVKFTVTPSSGKTVASAWWSFDAPAHLNTWNSRTVNPTFYYPQRGTFSPLVKLAYTDGSTETVQRTGYVTAT